VQTSGPTAFEWWTFAIAVAGFTLAGAGFAWRIYEWRRSGAQLRVLLKGGWRFPDNGIAPVPIESFDLTSPPAGAKPVLLVEVANGGRGPTEVSEWWVRIGDAFSGMTHPMDPAAIEAAIKAGLTETVMEKWDDIMLESHNERCPCVIAGGSRRVWVVDATKIAEHVRKLASADRPTNLGAMVNYGGGRSVDSGQHISPASIGLL
jgi:hypothetical protein